MRARSRPSRLFADRRGASVIEFGLALPVLALMVVGISDVAMSYGRKMSLEQAASRALERVTTGGTSTSYGWLAAEAAAAANVPESQVVVDAWLECDGVRQDSFQGVCADGTVIARYVEVTVNDYYVPSFDYGGWFQRDQEGRVPISASAALRIQ